MKKSLLVWFIFIILASPFSVFAQTDSSSLTVSPALAKLNLSTDPPEVDIFYTNNTSQAIQLSFESQDFTYMEQGWQVKFLNPQESANYHYSLSSWIHFDSPDMVLNPKETRSLKVSIDKNNLTASEHYGAVIAKINSADSSKLAVQAAVSSLIFVRSGSAKEIEEAAIDSVDAVRNYWQYPDRFVVRFRNSGNVDLTPYGTVEVTSPNGQKIAKGIFNDGSFITLPESIRRYDVIMPGNNQFLWPGEYSVHTVLHFGNSNKYIFKDSHFFSLGSISFTEIIIATILLLSLIFGSKKLISKAKQKHKDSK